MSDDLKLAKDIFGGSGSNVQNSSTSNSQKSTVTRTYGTCTQNSANGQVEVEINGTKTTLPCTTSIVASETNPRSVIIEISNNQGIVTGYAGWGDSIKTDVDNAANAANNAQSAADDARKVATNYIDIDENNGIVVGNMTDETLGKNTYIDANGFYVRDGETQLAKFGGNSVSLNSDNLVISSGSDGTTMYSNGGELTIRTNGAYSDGDFTKISSGNEYLTIAAYRDYGKSYQYSQVITISPMNEFIKNVRKSDGTTLGDLWMYGETTLCLNTTGTATGSITLYKSANLYKRLLIRAKKHDEDMYTYAFATPPATASASTSFSVTLDKAFGGGNWLRMIATCTISGTTLTINANKTYSNASMDTPQAENELKIVEVIGIA